MQEQISIILRTGITYVAGTCNGVNVTFQNQGNNLWTTSVTHSDDNIYNLYIIAYNEQGLTTELSTTLYYDMSLIFDRTIKDLYQRTDKSFYNAIDLNRVENATHYIENLLRIYSYFHSELTCKRNWQLSDFPTQTQMQRYLNNIQQLINCYYLKTDSPQLPSNMNDLTIQKANDIEKILFDMNQLIKNMIAEFCYCGEIFSGEV